ncbi:MAG: two-component regulator propeller domain-containing protein [Chitinophagaceae bacterium]
MNYEQGLLNNSTSNIITDTKGFTWISTKTGMQRYNGYELETINPIIDKKGIPINAPVYFFGLQNGLIWISYKEGVLEYDARKNSFRKVISLPGSENLNFLIIPLKETSKGILCMQFNKGIVLYSKQGKIVEMPSAVPGNFLKNVFNASEILPNKILAINKNSIFIYNGKDSIQQINFQTHAVNYIITKNIICFTSSDNFLYTVSGNQITIINTDDKNLYKNIPLENFIRGNLIGAAIYLKENGTVQISLNNHLFGFDANCMYQHEFTDLNRNPFAAQGFIRMIYTDSFKRIWLLTNDDIKRIQNANIPFEHLIYPGSNNNFIRSIYYDEEKHVLLAGCYNGGIQLYDTSGNALWEYAVSSQNVKDINAIEKLTGDEYLIETIGNGWYILHLSTKKITPFFLDEKIKIIMNTAAINFLNNLQRINDSTIFIANKFNVFNCIFKNERLVSVQPLLPFNAAVSNEISCFIYASDKSLWVSTVSGLVYRLSKSKELLTFSIAGNYEIRSLAEDAQHNIWIGSDKGLYVYNLAGTSLKSFTVQNGLLNDCIYALLPVGKEASIFASSNFGLSYVSLNGKIINYTKESGLQENEFNTGSAIKTTAGKFFFGGVNGITAFYTSSLSNIKDTPVLNVTKFIINDSLYNFSSFVQNDSMHLNYAQNHIQLDFTANGLFNANEYEYKYRLGGIEQNWQTTHQPTGIKYVLEPGTYIFEINCRPVFSSDNVIKKIITIIISPPWWQSLWFRIFMAIIFITTIALIVQQYLHKKYQKSLGTLQLQHEIQLERERISRDLHDNLGAYAAAIASNVATIKSSENGKEENIFSQLKNNSQSIINQLNDTIWALNKEAISLTAVSDRFKVFLQKIHPNYPGIQISIEENILHDEKLSPTNALHLFRIMQEAVNNALRHSRCTEIFINIVSDEHWKIIIRDDGIGMKDIHATINGGNGLQNIQLRSKEAGWQVSWEDASPKGTEFIIYTNTN